MSNLDILGISVDEKTLPAVVSFCKSLGIVDIDQMTRGTIVLWCKHVDGFLEENIEKVVMYLCDEFFFLKLYHEVPRVKKLIKPHQLNAQQRMWLILSGHYTTIKTTLIGDFNGAQLNKLLYEKPKAARHVTEEMFNTIRPSQLYLLLQRHPSISKYLPEEVFGKFNGNQIYDLQMMHGSRIQIPSCYYLRIPIKLWSACIFSYPETLQYFDIKKPANTAAYYLISDFPQFVSTIDRLIDTRITYKNWIKLIKNPFVYSMLPPTYKEDLMILKLRG